MEQKNLLLLDINSHIHRAYNQYTKKDSNQNSNNIKFLIQKSVNLIENEISKLERENITPDYVACIIDPLGKNFRHELYPEYKGTRPPTPENLSFIREETIEILKLKGYFIIRQKNVEADDVIATLSKKANNVKNLNIYICTRDKDLFYLINEKTFIFDGSENVIYDRKGCINKKGVPPEKILDYLTMNGDDIDNIKGIPDLGKKTIPRILEKYTLNQIIENPEYLADKDLKVRGKDKIIDYINKNKDFILLMQKLVQLKEDIDLGVNLKYFIKKYENKEEINKKMRSLKFK